jgi:hypothetical protein
VLSAGKVVGVAVEYDAMIMVYHSAYFSIGAMARISMGWFGVNGLSLLVN